MTRETLTAELLAMRKLAEEAVKKIEQIAKTLRAEKLALYQRLEDYNTKRVELVKQELRARGLTWCTRCAAIFPESEAELVLIEGTEEYTHGYGNSCYSFRNFSNLLRACPISREQVFDQHGKQGPYDSLLKNQESFSAFRVEKRDDGYYARKFGNWVKLDDGKYGLPELPKQLIEKLANDWNLPPRIEFKSERLFSEEKLVIHERTAEVAV